MGTIQRAGVDPLQKTGHPVKMEFDREENFLRGPPSLAHDLLPEIRRQEGRNPYRYPGKDDRGHGSLCPLSGAMDVIETMKGVYRCPNLKAEGYNVYTNKPEGGHSAAWATPRANSPRKSTWISWPRNWGWTRWNSG